MKKTGLLFFYQIESPGAHLQRWIILNPNMDK